MSYQVVFQTPVDSLFPDIYAKVESGVIERAQKLLNELDECDATNERIRFKRSFLRGIVAGQAAEPRSRLWENKKNMKSYSP